MKIRYIPVGWQQLIHNKTRLLIAVTGVAFSVLLLLAQQGIHTVISEGNLRWHNALAYDLVILNPATEVLTQLEGISTDSIELASSVEGVAGVTAVSIAQADWHNPVDPSISRPIFVVGIKPENLSFQNTLNPEHTALLKLPGHFLFDARSHPDYGPVPALLARGNSLSVGLNEKTIVVSGLFEIGRSFGINGALLASRASFEELFSDKPATTRSLGLVHLKASVDPSTVQENLEERLGDSVIVLKNKQFKQRETRYWSYRTPTGYALALGTVISLLVGAIVVYQVLCAELREHHCEYAMLKAIGYNDRFFSRLVLQEALILAIAGFVPGAIIGAQLLNQAETATGLPLAMTAPGTIKALLLTLLMSTGAGYLAKRKLIMIRPADALQ